MEEISRWNAPPPPRYCIEMDGGELDGGEVAREMTSPERGSGIVEFKMQFDHSVRPVEKDEDGPPPARPPKMRLKTGGAGADHGRRQPRKKTSPILSPLDEERSLRSDVSPVEGRRAKRNPRQRTPSPQLISPVD